MKKRITYIAFLLLIFVGFLSCSLPRAVEVSQKKRPSWVYGLNNGYIIIEGVGANFENAQNDVLKKLKERIVNSVAVNISSEMNISINETVIDNMSKYREDTQLQTNITTDFLNSLKGVSLSKSEAYYWEKQKYPNKMTKVHYHIMYPFTEMELNNLIKEWEQTDRAFTLELKALRKSVGACNRVADLKILRSKTIALEKIFTGSRKTEASIIKSEIEQLLDNLRFEVQKHERGRLVLKLLSSDRYFKMDSEVLFKSDCAILQDHKLINDDEALEINYDADFCFSVKNANFTISQNYKETEISIDFLIPDGENTVRFTVNDPIRLKRSSVNPQNLRWYIPMRVFTETDFTVIRVELAVSHSNIDLAQFIKGKEKESFYTAEINQAFTAKGDYSLQFEVQTSNADRKSLIGQLVNVIMNESPSYFAGGKIFIKTEGEEPEFIFVFENKRIVRSE
ncbi:MAG: hypothetical protein U9N51_09765 [Bacteroidota bacterium]|nr:hypothetical protein [Bacteroidota bacterium]